MATAVGDTEVTGLARLSKTVAMAAEAQLTTASIVAAKTGDREHWGGETTEHPSFGRIVWEGGLRSTSPTSMEDGEYGDPSSPYLP